MNMSVTEHRIKDRLQFVHKLYFFAILLRLFRTVCCFPPFFTSQPSNSFPSWSLPLSSSRNKALSRWCFHLVPVYTVYRGWSISPWRHCRVMFDWSVRWLVRVVYFMAFIHWKVNWWEHLRIVCFLFGYVKHGNIRSISSRKIRPGPPFELHSR